MEVQNIQRYSQEEGNNHRFSIFSNPLFQEVPSPGQSSNDNRRSHSQNNRKRIFSVHKQSEKGMERPLSPVQQRVYRESREKKKPKIFSEENTAKYRLSLQDHIQRQTDSQQPQRQVKVKAVQRIEMQKVEKVNQPSQSIQLKLRNTFGFSETPVLERRQIYQMNPQLNRTQALPRKQEEILTPEEFTQLLLTSKGGKKVRNTILARASYPARKNIGNL